MAAHTVLGTKSHKPRPDCHPRSSDYAYISMIVHLELKYRNRKAQYKGLEYAFSE